ncbi:MAG: hypothetical protein IJ326_13010 [Lachnospiraceae bacterium]|nr:hypothetical protein [Lachnospiraceae bacterium]
MSAREITQKLIRLVFAMIVGIFVTSFASGITTVNAATEVVTIEDEAVAEAAEAEDTGSAVFLLLGGMLLIIIAVVVTVVASVVVTAPIADEI